MRRKRRRKKAFPSTSLRKSTKSCLVGVCIPLKKRRRPGVRWVHVLTSSSFVKRLPGYTSHTIYNLWYQKADYDKFKKDVRKTVKKLEQGRRTSDAFHTTLGVTHLTAEERKIRSHNRFAAWDAVLNEQDLQEQLGRRSSALLADRYKNVSADAAEAAALQAQRAAQEVAKMYATHTVDDIEIMEPSNRLARRRNALHRSSSCNNLDLADILADMNLSASSLNDSGLNDWALTGL